MKKGLLLLLLSFLFINHLHSQNLLVNGDFESGGNGVGFNINGVGYNLITAPFSGTTTAGDYAFTTNPLPMNPTFFIAGGDHTTGTGNMMVIDGNSDATSPRFWRAGNTGGGICGLTIGATYRFSYWIKSVSTSVTNAATQANIGIQFNNVSSSSLLSGSAVAPLPASGWQKVTYTFVPSNTCVNIELWNINTSLTGNDFAVDDFVVSKPLALTYSTIQQSCPGLNDGAINVYGIGGVTPYVTYTISGTASQTNTTGVFTGLANGAYTVSVTDTNGTVVTQAGVVIGALANPLVTSFNSTICVGSPRTLSVTGGTTYLWTSSPLDPTLTDPTSATPTVTPTVATTYTVTSTVTRQRNLVFNGNFSSGNIGFTSDYQFLTASTPTGVQGAYGVVNNPSTWFAPFSTCGDHTNGTGNMMVVDGSIANGGNDRLWCQNIPVTPGLTYTFSYWIQTVATPNPASIEATINGSSLGIGIAPSVTTCGNWTQYTYTWNSGAATTALICLYDRTVTSAGNDFAIDDISFTTPTTCVFTRNVVITPVTPPTVTMSGSTNICPNSTAVLTFTGTPGASVLFTDNITGSFYTVFLNASGTASFTTPPIPVTTTFSLVSANSSPPGCVNNNVTGSAVITINSNGCATVLSGGVAIGAAVPPICNVGECRTITSTFVDLGTTTSYAVESIPYCPQAAFSDPTFTGLNVTTDDVWSGAIPLPFQFCFFGQSYNSANIGSNGVVTFAAVTGGCPWAYSQTIPNAGFPILNAIYGVYQDINPAVAPTPPAVISYNYKLEGTYPCRKLIVNFANVPQFSCGNSVGLQTSQIVLYEISNIIEVYVQRRVPCTSWNSGNGLIGIQNGAGSLAYTPPGRNTGAWTAMNEGWRFRPNGPSAVTFQWLQGTTVVGTTPTLSVCPTTTTTYTAQASYNVCGVPTVVSDDITVTVYPDLTQAPQDITQCTNIFNLNSNTPIMLGTLSPFDYSISYHTTLADAQNTANPITNTAAFPSSGQTIYVSILGPGSCVIVKDFDLIVSNCFVCETITNPSVDQTLCINDNPTPFSVNTGYTNTNSISFVYFNTLQTGTNMYSGGTLLGNVTPVGTVATYDAGVLGTPGSLPNVPGTYYVYAIANPLPSDPTCRPFQLITVVVNQQFTAGTSGGVTICETNTATIDLFSLITGEDLGGTWTQVTGSGGFFDAAAGTFTPSIGSTTSTFNYTVASLLPCANSTSTATVTINPQPVAGTDGSITICDSSTTTIDLFSLISGEQSGGVWSQTSGSGGVFDPIAGTFTPALGATSSTFNYTLTATSPCIDDFSVATITINAQLSAGTDGAITICDSSTTIVDLFSLITGENTGGVWTQISGTGGVFDSAAGTFAPTVGSTTSIFEYSVPGTLPCVGDTSSVTISINSQLNAGLDGSITICETNTTVIDLFSLISGEQSGGVWSQTSGSGGVFDPTAGTFTPTVGATSSTFTYTLSATSPCLPDSSVASIIINSQPNAGTDGSTTVCDSSTATIDLFSLITGEQPGGIWSQTSGSGGVFNAIAGTYTPAPGATNSVFTYAFDAVTPCLDDTSTATININPQPTAGLDGSTVVCETSSATIDLFSLISGEQTGGVWTQTSGSGGTFDAIAGTFTPAIGATTSVFQYEVIGTAPCVNDTSTATITINAQPTAGTDGSTTICETSTTSIDLFSLITGEQTGGVWTRTLGTGGNFNATAGTFIPAVGATTSTFVYTVTGTAPCVNDSSTAQVIINAQPNAGTDGATNVCESSTDVINLFTLITGEQTGGVWTRTAGTGGTFNAAAGTFTPGFGATTSTFRYTLTGAVPCVDDFSEVTITFVTAPIITQPTPFVVCDDSLNNDGIYCFDLSTKDDEITMAPGVQVTYHLTATDALIGANPLPNPYCNNDPSFQTIYPRVFDPLAPQCPSTTTLDLVVNPLPIPNPTISDYELCDVNNSPDGLEQFDLSTKNLEIANGLTGVTINYYLTETLAETNDITTALPTTYTNTTPDAQVIWFNISYTATGCNTTGSFNLIVNPLPLSTQPGYPQYELCDYDQTQLGQEEFDLSTQVTAILLNQNGMDVAFYPSLNEAISDTNEITNLLYTNVQPYAQTLGIRITNVLTGCFVTSTLDLVVNPLPTLVPPTQAYIVCGTSQNGQAEFDLNTLTAGIQGTGNYNISYHLTPEDAESGFNPIDLTVPYQNNSTIQFLYVRGEDTNGNGCFSVIQIELNVNPSPIVPLTLPNLVECDDDNNTQNGITAFDLEQQTPTILAAQTPPSSNYTVTYYTTLNDANLQQNPIVQTGTYPGTNGQTIWYVVENTPTTCAAVGSFQLVVNTPIVLTTPTLYKVCDNDTNPNNLFTTFDLVSFIGTIPGHTVTFYTNNSYTTLITTPDAFVNTIAANQTIGVLVTNNTTGCISRSTLTLSVLRVPTPRTDPPALPAQCDNNNPGDGLEVFNLTTNAAYIMNNDNSVTLHYYPSYQDAIDDTNEIVTPQTASVGGNVWIRVESNNSIDSDNENCYVLVEQALTVNPLPTVNPAISDYQICDNGSTPPPTFDLTTKIVEILGATQLPADYTVSFYTSQAEAQSGSNPIATPAAYPNTSNPQIIYVRVVNNTTGCVNATGQFTILINPKPTATAPADFATCDTLGPNDGFYDYPLTVLEAGILGTQNPNDFTVTFYDTFADADAGTNAITNEAGYLAYTHTVWIRVTNNVTGCYELTSFDVIVEQLPEPNITSSTGFNVLCVDYVTNIPASPLVLTANNTIPGTFTYQWFEGTTLLTGETNATYSVNTSAPAGATRTYTVVMTSASGATTPACDASDSFDVIQSGQASIVGPTGYTVTNAFTDNQIITVTVEGYGVYEYSLDNGPRQTSAVFTNVSLGNHTITVWDVENPGFSCDPLEILNVQTIDYPHYFTPNGDGIHDTWNIAGLSGQPNAKIYIFDRYGKLLKQISAAGTGWDGTYNGQMLPATDYWFTVEYLEQTVKEFKAHFSLKR